MESLKDHAKNINDILCIDFIGPLTISASKNKYIYHIKSAKTVSNTILKHWISLYGAPQTIRMDNSAEFSNFIIINMTDSLNVKIKVRQSYNHQSNPVERFHRSLWALLRAKNEMTKMIGKNLPTFI